MRILAPLFQLLARALKPLTWILSKIGDLMGWITDLTGPLYDAWLSLGSPIEWLMSAWDALGEAVSGIWDGITAAVKGALNIIIDAMNFLIRGINMFSIDVPDWVPVIGGSRFGFDIAEIPRLNEGGTITKSGIAEVHSGEVVSGTGGEAFAPVASAIKSLKTDLQMINQQLNSLNAKNEQYLGPGGILARQIGRRTAAAVEEGVTT